MKLSIVNVNVNVNVNSNLDVHYNGEENISVSVTRGY